MNSQGRPDVEKVLSGLKDFQRRTVDYVYRRLYEDCDPVDRFLIADEVGLGKTLVAKGVVAKAVDSLWERDGHRIDIVYICSNGDIARQNINRLSFLPEPPAKVDRLTLLPRTVKNLRNRRLNFVSFTPGTSFTVNSRSGTAEERALLYWMLRTEWGFGNSSGPKNLLQCGVVRADNWRNRLEQFDVGSIDSDLAEAFLRALGCCPKVRQGFEELAYRFRYARRRIPPEDAEARLQMVGKLRAILARSCASSLEPDLVILDEFQRFKDLLDGDDDGARLAQEFFKYPGAKTILLSATPYKMYTMYHESDSENHYEDFIRTAKFLFGSEQKTAEFEGHLASYRRGLLQLGSQGTSGLEEPKARMENALRKVMVRTERVRFTKRGDGMVQEVDDLEGLSAADLTSFALVDRIARQLGSNDVVEYWKSSPYLLNMMDKRAYKLKRDLTAVLGPTVGRVGFSSRVNSGRGGHPGQEIRQAMADSGESTLLSYGPISRYSRLKHANAKLRILMDNVIGKGAWQFLWVPASMPYYSVGSGPYSDERACDFTKALVFSSWQVVPKAISVLCSYEAERRMIARSGPLALYADEWRRRRPLLRFSLDAERRPGGMSALTLLYPCLTLARKIDPLLISALIAGADGQPPDIQEVADAVGWEVEDLLKPVFAKYAKSDEPEDPKWYWAALALLDHLYFGESTLPWADGSCGSESWSSLVLSGSRSNTDDDEDVSDDTNFVLHTRLFCEYLKGDGKGLGRPPQDLIQVLARIAIASPAVAAARALGRIAYHGGGTQGADLMTNSLLRAAGKVAFGFRTMFNLPETMALLRGNSTARSKQDDSAYWQLVLEYCALGSLQSVMDEYCHILYESLGLIGREPSTAIDEISKEISEALSIRTVPLTFDEFQSTPGKGDVRLIDRRVRCRFALRFGDARNVENKTETRAEQVRRAFNSPFRPFILATTSVGQEGLDFHQYCHDVYHWNLPSNPVDLEQREGRIHRYKGHVIRRNVAKAFGARVIEACGVGDPGDPWERMFDLARDSRNPKSTDLEPYWVCEVEGGHRVRRHIPAMPLSRELGQIEALKKTLVAYRMVFGQPRQEDLVEYLSSRAGVTIDRDTLDRLRVDLGPR